MLSVCGASMIRLPDRVCQPELDLPVQTSYSVLPSAFAALGIGSFGIEADP